MLGVQEFHSKPYGTGRLVTSHQDKEAELHRHYSAILGHQTLHDGRINLDSLQLPNHDLQTLDARFSEEEIKKSRDEWTDREGPRARWFYKTFLQTVLGHYQGDLVAAI